MMLVHTWFKIAWVAERSRAVDLSQSLTSLTGLSVPILLPNIISVLCSSSWMLALWYAARSICEYCLAPASSAEMRLLASAIWFISSSVSMVYFSQPIAPGSVAEQSTILDGRLHPFQPVDVEPGLDEGRCVVPRAGDAVVFQPVTDLVLAIGGLQRSQFLGLGFGDLLGDLVLDADQHAQRLGGELAVGEHRQLVAHLAHTLAQVGHGARGGPGRVVELMGQPGRELPEGQQFLAAGRRSGAVAGRRPCAPRAGGRPSGTRSA